MANGWRTVVIEKRCKLDYRLGYLRFRTEFEEKSIFLDEVAVLLIEEVGISLTCYLLQELTNRKIKVIFCDSKRNPCAELQSLYGSFDTSKKYEMQLSWKTETKSKVWKEIIKQKISRQRELLLKIGRKDSAGLLSSYADSVEDGDATNREGMAAKVYFRALFGVDFNRDDAGNYTNSFLDYGYTLLNSLFNRSVCACGYATQLGIWHSGGQNPFNLSSDLMEPFRPVIDQHIRLIKSQVLDSSTKHFILRAFDERVRITGTFQTLINAVPIWVTSVFDALNNDDVELIKKYEL